MLKKFIVPVCLLLILMTANPILEANPRMVVEEKDFDFGFAPQKSKISHTFWIKSDGEDSLKILKVIPGCGCTQAPLEKSEIAPEDSSRLEIIFSTRTYKNSVSKSPKIITNEGPPDKSVKIMANIVADGDSTYPLVFNPFKLYITSFGKKSNDEMSFEITNVSDETIELSIIDCPSDIMKVDIPQKIKAGDKKTGSIKINNPKINTIFEKSFTIELNDLKKTRYTIPVKRDNTSLSGR